ncbi:MAG: hypothetical protein K6E13_09580 [Lachnospiraceae bacterium]|nr:hypothetical protein [Lachnospiraceae bacterium]
MKEKKIKNILVYILVLTIVGTSILGTPSTAKANMTVDEFFEKYPDIKKCSVDSHGWVVEDPDYDPYYGYSEEKKEAIRKMINTSNSKEGDFVCNVSGLVSDKTQYYKIAKYKQRKLGYKKTLKLSEETITVKKGKTVTIKCSALKKYSSKNKKNKIAVQVDKTRTNGRIFSKEVRRAKVSYSTKKGTITIKGTKKGYCDVTVRVGKKYNIVRVTIK